MSPSLRVLRSTLALLVLIFWFGRNRKGLKQYVYIKKSQEKVKDERVSPPYRTYSQGSPMQDMLAMVSRSLAGFTARVPWMFSWRMRVRWGSDRPYEQKPRHRIGFDQIPRGRPEKG